MTLVQINKQTYVNPNHVIAVNFITDKLQTLVILKDKAIVESDLTLEETLKALRGSV